ncbi:hypothetical protein AVEN_146916-1 [Araneus ventricosus]|uniref:Uncharacterized protein n=1 Tax=Araneus ventricosus TaxID=182803 RepID=A0A4Y2UFU5_ARAVE|nr:hypothetical protein AVEN_146916-1 [Araneus ventricosus]
MGVILIDLLTSGTISTVHYCDTLTKLKSAIRRQRPRVEGFCSWMIIEIPYSKGHKRTYCRLGWESLDHPITVPPCPTLTLPPFPTMVSERREVTSEAMKSVRRL